MRVKNIPLLILRPVVRRLYSGPIKDVGDRFGLTSKLANLYWSLLFRISGKVVRQSVSGVTVEFKNETVSEFARNENLMDEGPVIKDILENLDEGDVFFDVGANVGLYTCFVASVLPNDQVYAFEPHPANIAGLNSNLDLNSISAEIRQCALTSENREIELAVANSEVGVGTHSSTVEDREETVLVPGYRGDSLIGKDSGCGVDSPTIIKIDVEGAEYGVLQGLEDSISDSSCKRIYCEIHPSRLPNDVTEDQIQEFLCRNEFSTEILHSRDDEYFLKATRDNQTVN